MTHLLFSYCEVVDSFCDLHQGFNRNSIYVYHGDKTAYIRSQLTSINESILFKDIGLMLMFFLRVGGGLRIMIKVGFFVLIC